MYIIDIFHEEVFTADTRKKAYLEACKWLANNVVDKAEVGETMYDIKSVENADGANSPAFKVRLWCLIDESEHRADYCKRCKMHHNSIFFNQFYDCNKCYLKAHLKQMDEKVKIKTNHRRRKIRYLLSKRKI